jgi:hypothetical protein
MGWEAAGAGHEEIVKQLLNNVGGFESIVTVPWRGFNLNAAEHASVNGYKNTVEILLR